MIQHMTACQEEIWMKIEENPENNILFKNWPLRSLLVLPHSPSSPFEETSTLPVLISWQYVVSVIKLKFEGYRVPPSPRKRTYRVRDDSSLHQEEEEPVFHLPLFPTLQESFGVLQEDLRNLPPKLGATDSGPHSPESFSSGWILGRGGQSGFAPIRQQHLSVLHEPRLWTLQSPHPREDSFSCQVLLHCQNLSSSPKKRTYLQP